MDLSDKNIFCKEAKITSGMLLHDEQFSSYPALKNGLVLELLKIKKSHDLSWPVYTSWIEKIVNNSQGVSINALRRSVLAVDSRRDKLRRCRIGRDRLVEFLEEEHRLPERQVRSNSTSRTDKPPQVHVPKYQIVDPVNVELAAELSDLKSEVAATELKLTVKEKKIEKVTSNSRNLKKKIRRKEDKISILLAIIGSLKREKTAPTKTKHAKSLSSLVHFYKAKCNYLQNQLRTYECKECNELDETIRELKEEKKELLEMNARLIDENKESKKISFYSAGKYSDDLRICIMELLTSNVSVLKVEPVLRSVFKLLSIQCDRLPQHTTINEMLMESRSISHAQLAETLTASSSNTLHSDGTTKYGHKFQSYQVTTSGDSLTLGLQEVASGEAVTTLTVLQDIIEELAENCKISDAAENIICNIKSTMSDRAATQKSFNALLASYRANILPNVVTNWNALLNSEQAALSEMHNFYCGMHLVVNMAEHTSEALKLIERNYDSPVTHAAHPTNEPSTIRLIRTACKAFQKRADEKSGCPLQFATYIKKKGIKKNPLVHFRGNRFNVVFANGARIYYLHQHIADFLQSWGTQNRLLQAVLEDVGNPVNIAGCKALGLIDKHITGPLWRILESNVHVLDILQYYSKLRGFLESCTEANISLFMAGEEIPFDSEYVKKDELWVALVSPSNNDGITGHMLLSIFKAFGLLLERVLADLLPVTQAEEENKEELRETTSSVPTTNTISERDFAIFDRLLREKPHASTLALEAHILFTNNKTSKWLSQKSASEREKLMKEARKNAPQYRKAYQQRIFQIEEETAKQVQDKVKKSEDAQRKLLETKEKLSSELINYGLWQSSLQVDSALTGIKSETQKRAAIKVQLRFRKTFLQQQAPDFLYRFSSKERGQYTSQILRDNLVKLIGSAEEKKVPVSHLVGKLIKHKFEESGKHKFYEGRIISQVPGFSEWYNIVYKEEPDIVYSYKLTDDIENGDLELMEVHSSD